jgi:hypothetical protein
MASQCRIEVRQLSRCLQIEEPVCTEIDGRFRERGWEKETPLPARSRTSNWKAHTGQTIRVDVLNDRSRRLVGLFS